MLQRHTFGFFTDVLAEAMYGYAPGIESDCGPVREMSAPCPLA
jgi:hypothetical protein